MRVRTIAEMRVRTIAEMRVRTIAVMRARTIAVMRVRREDNNERFGRRTHWYGSLPSSGGSDALRFREGTWDRYTAAVST